MSKETGGQAFPFTPHIESKNTEELGMTLRDYFAAKAMQGILSNPSMIDSFDKSSFDWVAERASQQADAMLKARNS
ncbi:hypothetical protein KDV60_03370 [Serratia marcescens]|uniref:hypothetical protein n=1 Tax=Serratia marcescens TaxID=615 RepID=UPI0033171A8E